MFLTIRVLVPYLKLCVKSDPCPHERVVCWAMPKAVCVSTDDPLSGNMPVIKFYQRHGFRVIGNIPRSMLVKRSRETN